MQIEATVYRTTRETIVERIPVKAQRAPKRPIPFGEPLRVSPKKQPVAKEPEHKPSEVLREAAALIICDGDGPAFKQWTEPSGLVLTIARSTQACAEVLRMVEAAFPPVKA